MLLGIYIYLAWMPYSSEVLGFLHVNPANDACSGSRSRRFMNSLLF